MENEIWKPVTKITTKNGDVWHFEGYDVSNYGRLRSYHKRYGKVAPGSKRSLNTKPVIINGRPDQKGYIQYLMYETNKKRHNVRAHTALMQTFIGLPKEYHVVCHNDDVKTNNHISNLRYDTQKENLADIKRNSKK